MKTLFLYEYKPHCPWIGDFRSLEVLVQGLKKLGHEALISNDPNQIDFFDTIVLSNISTDLTPLEQILHIKNRPFSLIPFHEDFLLYTSIYRSFFAYVANALISDNPHEAIHFLEYMPDILYYEPFAPKRNALINQSVMAKAEICIANSPSEEKLIQRSCPLAKTSTIFWTSGYVEKDAYRYSAKFIKRFNLPKKGYILQIGRIGPRKNQLATILAARDLELPLVFVATGHFPLENEYLNTCLLAAKKFRKGPTLFLTNAVEEMKENNIEVINVKEGLTTQELMSAYQNAAVYCHPAFYELPGYVYLEAAKLGTPCVASSWSTLKDYFTETMTGSYTLDNRIEYILPYDLKAIKTAILNSLDKSFSPSNHPIFQRTDLDVAKEFLGVMSDSL